MTQTTILAPGSAAAASSDIDLAAGVVVAVGIYSEEDAYPRNFSFAIMKKTPGEPHYMGQLDGNRRATLLEGPGTYYVLRPELTAELEFGVYKDA